MATARPMWFDEGSNIKSGSELKPEEIYSKVYFSQSTFEILQLFSIMKHIETFIYFTKKVTMVSCHVYETNIELRHS